MVALQAGFGFVFTCAALSYVALTSVYDPAISRS